MHLERLCSPVVFFSHACEKQPSCCSHCARAGEFPVCRDHSSKQALEGIIKSLFPNRGWITGTDLQFCLRERLGCCAFISRHDCICNDVCLCSNRKVWFQLRWVLPALASAYQQRCKYVKENKMNEDAAVWVWAWVSNWNMSLLGMPKTCHAGLVAKTQAHAVTSLMPLLLKFVKNLYKTRQT